MAGIADRMKSEGLKFGMKAVSKLMESPERAEKMMKAVETVQKSRERVDETAQRLLNFGQLPSRDDLQEVSRHLGRLRRETKKILAALDDLDAKL
jgi:capsule polysaccharide export protein KpsE/RkpR